MSLSRSRIIICKTSQWAGPYDTTVQLNTLVDVFVIVMLNSPLNPGQRRRHVGWKMAGVRWADGCEETGR